MRFLAGMLLFYAAGALATALLPLEYEPRTDAERKVIEDSFQLHAAFHDNPIGRLLAAPIILRTEATAVERVPRSCESDPYDVERPHNRDLVVTLTGYTVWGIPIRRQKLSCGGWLI